MLSQAGKRGGESAIECLHTCVVGGYTDSGGLSGGVVRCPRGRQSWRSLIFPMDGRGYEPTAAGRSMAGLWLAGSTGGLQAREGRHMVAC